MKTPQRIWTAQDISLSALSCYLIVQNICKILLKNMLMNHKYYELRQNIIRTYKEGYCNAEIDDPASFMTLKSLTQQKVTSSRLVHQQSKRSLTADVCCLEINKLNARCVFHLSSTVTVPALTSKPFHCTYPRQ